MSNSNWFKTQSDRRNNSPWAVHQNRAGTCILLTQERKKPREQRRKARYQLETKLIGYEYTVNVWEIFKSPIFHGMRPRFDLAADGFTERNSRIFRRRLMNREINLPGIRVSLVMEGYFTLISFLTLGRSTGCHISEHPHGRIGHCTKRVQSANPHRCTIYAWVGR